MSEIPALEKLREEESKFKASLGYTVKPCLKNINKKRRVCVGERERKVGEGRVRKNSQRMTENVM